MFIYSLHYDLIHILYCFVFIIFLLLLSHRIYLGLALSLQKEGPGVRTKECVTYLLESMEVLLTDLSKKATTFAENMSVC